MNSTKKWLAGVAFVALAPFASAAPNLIVNGSFESNSLNFTGSFSTLSAGSNALTGWTIAAGSVDLINKYWTASQGHYSLDLSGADDGTISQSFATVVGQTYKVSFDMAGNPDGPDTTKYLQVGMSQQPIYEFDTTGKNHANMGWTTKSFVFQAVSGQSTLHFTGLQESPYGMALDNISVSAVPEPESFAMLLAGLGLVGAAVRRKRNAASF
ncbi:choice-of-anchor C family PEP-CTERM protein [Rhodoferax bucti]|uniref:choice-of-anchor C family PEP-CTERM protein n=1 Tax=Rhodoferax bucti TaxID=2576305 RepID=UPI00110982EC|nr:choice-of-anchor C family protein [Rhodoferax bucti]